MIILINIDKVIKIVYIATVNIMDISFYFILLCYIQKSLPKSLESSEDNILQANFFQLFIDTLLYVKAKYKRSLWSHTWLKFLTYIDSSEHEESRANAKVVDAAQDDRHGEKLQTIALSQQTQNG